MRKLTNGEINLLMACKAGRGKYELLKDEPKVRFKDSICDMLGVGNA